MNDLKKLETVLVADVMSRNVIDVEVNQSMCCAASCLAQHGLSAAPVVDEQGRCVGILSGSDFVKRECRHGEESESALAAQEFELVKREDREPFCIQSYPEERVRNHMTATVQTVSAQATLLHAATVMQQEQIHHLVVLDEHERPMGVLSTLDLISVLLSEQGESDDV